MRDTGSTGSGGEGAAGGGVERGGAAADGERRARIGDRLPSGGRCGATLASGRRRNLPRTRRLAFWPAARRCLTRRRSRRGCSGLRRPWSRGRTDASWCGCLRRGGGVHSGGGRGGRRHGRRLCVRAGDRPGERTCSARSCTGTTRRRSWRRRRRGWDGNTTAALMVVERNNHGHAVLAMLERVEQYEPIYADPRLSAVCGVGDDGADASDDAGEVWGDAGGAPGAVPEPGLLEECRSFVRHADGRIAAAEGSHDDAIMAMAMALAVREAGYQAPRLRSRAAATEA